MKTVFKVGMEVYDQVNNPNKKGKVLNIKENEFCHKIHYYDYPIEVQFEGKDDLSYYDLEGCPVWSPNPTLSTKPYTLQGFEQKAPAPTFEEAWEETDRIYEPKSEYDKEEFGGYPSQELADASEALRRLLFLRDYYNEGWQPDWDNSSLKYIVYIKVDNGYNFIIDYRAKYPRVLHFKSKEIAEKFLKEQKELLEMAKPLL